MSNVQKMARTGQVVIPVRLRKKMGFTPGELVLVEEFENGVLFRPAKIDRGNLVTATLKAHQQNTANKRSNNNN